MKITKTKLLAVCFAVLLSMTTVITLSSCEKNQGDEITSTSEIPVTTGTVTAEAPKTDEMVSKPLDVGNPESIVAYYNRFLERDREESKADRETNIAIEDLSVITHGIAARLTSGEAEGLPTYFYVGENLTYLMGTGKDENSKTVTTTSYTESFESGSISLTTVDGKAVNITLAENQTAALSVEKTHETADEEALFESLKLSADDLKALGDGVYAFSEAAWLRIAKAIGAEEAKAKNTVITIDLRNFENSQTIEILVIEILAKETKTKEEVKTTIDLSGYDYESNTGTITANLEGNLDGDNTLKLKISAEKGRDGYQVSLEIALGDNLFSILVDSSDMTASFDMDAKIGEASVLGSGKVGLDKLDRVGETVGKLALTVKNAEKEEMTLDIDVTTAKHEESSGEYTLSVSEQYINKDHEKKAKKSEYSLFYPATAPKRLGKPRRNTVKEL